VQVAADTAGRLQNLKRIAAGTAAATAVVQIAADTAAATAQKNLKKSCHASGNCYKGRNLFEPWEERCENLRHVRGAVCRFVRS
jgi:hypothetical protein